MNKTNPASNPLLVPITDYVNYALVKPEHIKPAIEHLIQTTRQAIEHAANSTEAPNWDNLVDPIENESALLQRAWSIAGHLNNVVNTPELRQAINDCLPMMSEFSTWVGLHTGLYQRYRQLAESPAVAELSPSRQHIINLALRDFRLSGVELAGESREKYANNAELQAQVSQKFSENVMDATDGWHLDIHDEAELDGIPDDVKNAARNLAQTNGDDGWRLSLHMPCYLPVMQHAKNQELRKTIYKAYATRASDQGDAKYDNSESIESLLSLRAEEAHLLGYDNFAELRLETRMADNPAQVLNFLRTLAKKARPSAEQDLQELQQFAQQDLGLEKLEPWDVAYASERLREKRYTYSDQEVRAYFTESNVVSGLFSVINKIYGVKLQACDAPSWHADARIYQVLDQNNNELGRLGMDLYARPGKQGGAWVDSERSRRRYQGQIQTPLVWLTCNFSRPTDEHDALLSHDDVITIFHESGHAMHALLSRVDDPAASAFAAVEWDAIELPSQFMENFCWEWEVVQLLSKHYQTGEKLPKALFDKMLAAKNFQSGLQTLRQVEFALFDMLIHTQRKSLSITAVLDTLDQVRQEVALIIPPSWHRFPHAFSHLFAGGYGAGYYSYKWAEVLSADAYAAFEENATDLADGTRDVFDPNTCKRYLDEIIAVGGTRPAAESFKAFRGRQPELDALLRHSGLSN